MSIFYDHPAFKDVRLEVLKATQYSRTHVKVKARWWLKRYPVPWQIETLRVKPSAWNRFVRTSKLSYE